MNKLGQGHVEIILSATLFIGFLIFVFIFLNSSLKSGKELPVSKVQDAIIDRISSDVGKLSVAVTSSNNCYSLGQVNDEYGTNFVETIDNQRKYTIYYGDFFDNNIIGKISCSGKPEDYKLGTYIEESIIVYDKILELKQSYDNNYESLKNSLNIEDFSFQFKDNGQEIQELSVKPNIPENVDVASKDLTVRVINNKAEIKEFVLNIKTWN